MKKNIVEFPAEAARSWASFEKNLKDFSQKKGLTKEAETELISRMRPFFDMVNVKLAFPERDNSPENFDRAIAKCVSDLHHLIAAIVRERIDIELERLVLTRVIR